MKDLDAWLTYIESLHPKSIAMGLDRVRLMIDRLQLNPNFPIITVAGTNGKGSTCAMLAQIYQQAGYRVACYSSPHLLRYNERVRINGVEASNADLCVAFEAIDQARMDTGCVDGLPNIIPLTYFEVGTLSAMWHFMQVGVDVAILEIGLGGRLDAVNAFNSNCAVVTSVDLDHQDFLGDTRELIGLEKAGVYRSDCPAICGDSKPPESLIQYAHEINADLKCIHQDFSYLPERNSWQYQAGGNTIYTLPIPALQGTYQLSNAVCAVTAVEYLQTVLPVKVEAIANAMHHVKLAGRFQQFSRRANHHTLTIILDVAHNPHAARALADNLSATPKANKGKTYAVFAMLADKDIHGVINAVKNEIDSWYVASIDHARGALAIDLAKEIESLMPQVSIKTFNSADQAYQQACMDIESRINANENDKIIVFGSFYTVATVLPLLS